jgi:NitT/TauT family transport system permease protein
MAVQLEVCDETSARLNTSSDPEDQEDRLAAEPLEIVSRVVLPAIRPNLLASLRVAVGLIWVVLVPAEMLGVSSGLGYLILDCQDRLAYGELTAVLLLIGAIGWLLDAGLRSLSREGHV